MAEGAPIPNADNPGEAAIGAQVDAAFQEMGPDILDAARRQVSDMGEHAPAGGYIDPQRELDTIERRHAKEDSRLIQEVNDATRIANVPEEEITTSPHALMDKIEYDNHKAQVGLAVETTMALNDALQQPNMVRREQVTGRHGSTQTIRADRRGMGFGTLPFGEPTDRSKEDE